MAQVMVNFRLDEDVKKNMEQACREMGLSMTTAFTIFATKVGKEKRIPFEITAQNHGAPPRLRQGGRAEGEEEAALSGRQERLQRLCTQIRRSLTSIHTAIPSSITGLTMERVRLLCGDELKDKAAQASNACRSLFSGRSAEMLKKKDLSILDEYIDGLSCVERQLEEIECALVPAMKSWSGEDTGGFEPYERGLSGISRKFDELSLVLQRFFASTACDGGARDVAARVRRAAGEVETDYVLTALERLESLILRHYDALEEQTSSRLESDYLQTLELTLRELGRAEQEGGDAAGRAALCLRVINVLSQVIFDGRQAREEWNGRSLEAEVSALERLAAMRGDVADKMKPEG